jgi:methyl-accepting chemotaxis protein
MRDIDEQGKLISQLVQQQTQATEQALNESSEINELAQHTLSSARETQANAFLLTDTAAVMEENITKYKTE